MGTTFRFLQKREKRKSSFLLKKTIEKQNFLSFLINYSVGKDKDLYFANNNFTLAITDVIFLSTYANPTYMFVKVNQPKMVQRSVFTKTCKTNLEN